MILSLVLFNLIIKRVFQFVASRIDYFIAKIIHKIHNLFSNEEL
jgi:hypothetical protein